MRRTTRSFLTASLLLAASTFAAQAAVVPYDMAPGSVSLTVLEDDGNLLNAHTWVTFDAQAGTTITLASSGTSDPCLELYLGDVDGLDFGAATGDCGAFEGSGLLTTVAFNDDGGPGLNALISVVAATTGTYSLYMNDLFTNNVTHTLTASFTPPVAPVPLPATMGLSMAGIAAFGLVRDRRRRFTTRA